jgi:GMP synthase PP-ATPase subunit
VITDPAIRFMFTREYLLQSDWYQERLKIKQQRDYLLWQKHHDYILKRMSEIEQTDSLNQIFADKLEVIKRMLVEIAHVEYLENLQGTLGADWVHH